ncbi:hypothetical protein [Amycolatopsis alba]|uniref:Uncharacterized protein n=1 Tax=Amycolatopsis alba DSM 44262 TaxID=1125972 RepID=A0A229RB15_AMYAL|nr:hypothetical protein [Amycolatopsis alba]OXM43863.1 hypothetical protein CFP75_36725 [Amycolatopsis alba DSM 44262]
MLDTNLWSSIGDEEATAEFNAEMAARGVAVVTPPSILIEVARLPVAAARQRIITALTTGHRVRLRTEAALEAAEIIAEAKRLRPHWLRRMPDTGRTASLDTYWTKKLWREAAEDSTRIHEYQVETYHRPTDYLVAKQKEQRKAILETDFNVRPLTAIMVKSEPDTPEEYLDGWSGEPVEAWRIESWHVYRYNLFTVGGRAALTREDTTRADWVGAYLDLRIMRSDTADFGRFWTQDVEVTRMPRNWLRWAVRFVQSTQKIGPGNPADEQHSAYLPDCDVFVSADARYITALRQVRADAPFEFAKPLQSSGDRSVPVTQRIAEALDSA